MQTLLTLPETADGLVKKMMDIRWELEKTEPNTNKAMSILQEAKKNLIALETELNQALGQTSPAAESGPSSTESPEAGPPAAS